MVSIIFQQRKRLIFVYVNDTILIIVKDRDLVGPTYHRTGTDHRRGQGKASSKAHPDWGVTRTTPVA